jgi:hypothetical protein
MSKAASIYDGLKYLYAEQLHGKRYPLTIKSVSPEEITGDGGRKSMGHVLSFDETDKMLVVSGATIKRQLAMATGTEEPAKMAGQKITLYAVKSTRSISGQAIRIAIPEALA